MPITAPALKAHLPRTWSALLRPPRQLHAAQLAAIPPLLDGQNVILCAATASGKTEAALAPLVERHLPPTHDRNSSPSSTCCPPAR